MRAPVSDVRVTWMNGHLGALIRAVEDPCEVLFR